MGNIEYIYTLLDPRDGLIKYIGKTNNTSKRLIQHCCDFRTFTKKVEWIMDLKINGLKPSLEIIDIVSNDNIFWENFYIDLYKSWGFELKNSNHTKETREKMSISMKISCKRKEAKIRLSNNGKKSKGKKRKSLNNDHKIKISIKMTGRVISENTKEKMKLNSLNRKRNIDGKFKNNE